MRISPGRLVIFLVFLTLFAYGCAYVKKDLVQIPCTTDSIITYNTHVAPILSKNCYTCHSAASNVSGILLDTYDGLKYYATINNNSTVNATSNYLMGTISHASGYNAMPQSGGKLSDCDIAIIQKWISTGLKEN